MGPSPHCLPLRHSVTFYSARGIVQCPLGALGLTHFWVITGPHGQSQFQLGSLVNVSLLLATPVFLLWDHMKLIRQNSADLLIWVTLTHVKHRRSFRAVGYQPSVIDPWPWAVGLCIIISHWLKFDHCDDSSLQHLGVAGTARGNLTLCIPSHWHPECSPHPLSRLHAMYQVILLGDDATVFWDRSRLLLNIVNGPFWFMFFRWFSDTVLPRVKSKPC